MIKCFLFSLGTLDKLKKIAYNKRAKLETPKGESQFNFIVLSQEDIIKVGLYLLSCLQKIPCDELWTSLAAYEKGIFYGAVLVRGRHLLMEC